MARVGTSSRAVRSTVMAGVLAAVALAGCSSDDSGSSTTVVSTTEPTDTAAPTTEPITTEPVTTEPVTSAPVVTEPVAASDVSVGASSRSVLPTVDGGTDYLADAPGWSSPVAPDDIGVFVPAFDQGRVDVGNGESDASWVHDDLRVTAVALERGDERVVLVSADVYMIFAADAAEIVARSHAGLPDDWSDAPIIVSATHNHHGPDSAFSINDDWYDHFADQAAAAVVDAVASVVPATVTVAAGENRFGVDDARDPIVLDPRLNVLVASDASSGDAIATLVQWNSHPETTLGWEPVVEGLEAACEEKGWAPDDCSAEGRYFTADYPGMLRERVVEAIGGEVAYFNGAVGSQIGPGRADVWAVAAGERVEDGWSTPADAEPVPGCDDLSCRNFARNEAIGEQLTLAVLDLVDAAEPLAVEQLTVRTQPFWSRLTNIGFRVLLADGSLGWQDPVAYICDGTPSADTCRSDEGAIEDDPLLTALDAGSIRSGDVLQTQISHLDLGSVGMLFMPGELPPELVVGLPADFETNPEKYYRDPIGQHAVGADYRIPGYLLDLVDEDITFTVGLGGDELGYWVPLSEARLKCLDLVLTGGITCQSLFDAGLLVTPDAVGGEICHALEIGSSDIAGTPEQLDAVRSVCRYGQALGRELGEPEGHYEETNAAGWNLVDDTWAAAVELFGTEGSGGINPDNPGDMPD